MAKFAYIAIVSSITSKVKLEIVNKNIPRSSILTLYGINKYNVSKKNSAEGESLIKKIFASNKTVIKSLTSEPVHQACIYKKFHLEKRYKFDQKI